MPDLLSHFTQVRKSGAGWSCRCPAHADEQASLSISRGDRQPWVMRCHAGCSTEAIVAAAGLTMQDLLEPRERRANDSARRTTRYEIRDVDGQIVAIHERTDTPSGKRFIWRQPDGTLGLAGRRVVDLPLYGAETLREVAKGSTVVLCEGEHARDAVVRAGLVAVATVTGAAATPSDDVLRVLVPYRVVLWADADTPGREHMARIAARLLALSCGDVRRVEWPDGPEHGDAADYRGDLRALVEAAPSIVAPSRSPVVTMLSSVEPEDVDWLWPGRFARGKYTLAAGEPGLGKTYLMLDTSARCSRGAAFPDGAIAPRGRALILTAEDGLADTIRPRLDALGADCSQIAVLEAVREADGTRSPLSLVKDLDILAAAIRAVRPIFVGIDPLSAYLGRTDTHRDAEVRSALAPLLDMAEQERFALVGICHLSKDQQKAALHRPGGSIAFVAAARVVLALAADPHDPDRRLLASIKSNICRPAATLAYRITADRLVWEADAVQIDVADIFRPATSREDQTDAEAVIRELLADEAAWPMAAKDAIEAATAHGITERTMRYTARKLGIEIRKAGFRGGWLWHRPAEAATKGQEDSQGTDDCRFAASAIPSEKEEEILKSVRSGNVAGSLGGGSRERV